MTNEEEIILSYPKLEQRLSGRSSEIKKALKIIKEIRANVSTKTLDRMEGFLDSTLGKLYDGVHLTSEKDSNFSELVQAKNVVLVPNHQSHADYIALGYAFWKNFKSPLYVAGGNNLNVFPIGQIFRKCGCFFIRRSFAKDILYKLTLEAYLFYLLHEGRPIEFFFEGGRSRTGKLRSPKFGLYSMILEAHGHLPEGKKKELAFLPISVIHEYVPETRSLAKELKGGRKIQESTGQLLKLFKLFKYHFGTIHLHIGKVVKVKEFEDKKKMTQTLAFDCFREVGKNIKVTPSSVLALMLLDETQGALEWEDILLGSWTVVSYCDSIGVPYTDSLKGDKLEESLRNAMTMLIGNNKVRVIGQEDEGPVFYSIKPECRVEILYFKNTILNHLLVPWVINAAWIKIFTGQVSSVGELKKLFVDKRDQLKYEFYLPTVKEFFNYSMKIISDAIGRPIRSLEDCLKVEPKELYSLATNIGVFSRSCNYLVECYYVSFLTVRALHKSFPDGFKTEQINKESRKIFDSEMSLGRILKFPESYSLPVIQNGISLLQNKNILSWSNGSATIRDIDGLELMIKSYEQDLYESLSFNMKIHKI